MMVNFSLVYLQTMYNMFCLLLKIPVERNNIMTKYSVKKEWFINSLNNWYFRKAIFSRSFSAGYHILKKKKKKLYWANVAVVFKITILLLVTYLVSLNCPVTLGIIDQNLSNFQRIHNYGCRFSLKNYMRNG